MADKQGYFSLVQYSQFPERGEYVNLGVILFAGSPLRAWIEFSRTPRRAERAFRVSLGRHFRDLQDSLQKRLEGSVRDGWRREELEQFIAMRSGRMRLSPLKSVLVSDPGFVLNDLFNRLVGEVPHHQRGPQAKTKLAKRFKDAAVDQFLFRPDPIDLSGGVRVEAPFAYRNGAVNLINAVSLAGDPDKALVRASPLMIEGKLLVEESGGVEPRHLVVVGEHAETQEPDFVNLIERQMEDHKVRFFRSDRIDPLVSDIRAHARVV
jgi:hypothetical protein